MNNVLTCKALNLIRTFIRPQSILHAVSRVLFSNLQSWPYLPHIQHDWVWIKVCREVDWQLSRNEY